MKQLLLILGIFLLISSKSFSRETEWSCKVIYCNDTYSGEYYSHKDAIGIPDDYPVHGARDNGSAWIMGYNLESNLEHDINIKVGFCRPIKAQQVAIVECFNPGAITEVYIYTTKGEEKRVYKSEPLLATEKARVLNIFFPLTKDPVNAVKIVAKPSQVDGWNYIDAIGISSSSSPEKAELNPAKDMALVPAHPLSASINTQYMEKYPIISPDGLTLYFDRDGDPTNVGTTKDDIWYSYKSGKEWSKAKNIGKPLNNDSYNFVASITPDGNTLLLANTYNTDGSSKGGGASITHRTKTGWSMPENLDIKEYDNQNDYCSFFLANDGKTLLVDIEDDNSLGDLDVYVSFLNADGSWTKPMNLGPDVNTFGADATPFLASDNKTMYFASTGHIGYGGYDIFMTRRLDDTWKKWSKPVNLGLKINSSGGDLGFSVDASGKNAYTYSWNNDVNQSDVYVVELANSVKPEPVVLVKGKVYDAKTKQPITAKIIYELLPSGKEAGQARSNPSTGDYKVVLPVGKHYGYLAQAEGYIAIHQNLEVPQGQLYTEVTQDLYLMPIEIGQAMNLNNVFFIQSKAELLTSSYPELDRIVDIMKDNPTIEIELGGHTDNVGDAKKNLALSEERVIQVKNYLVSKGVKAGRISVKAYGGSKPIASNAKEETRKLNRRVEFTIIKK